MEYIKLAHLVRTKFLRNLRKIITFTKIYFEVWFTVGGIIGPFFCEDVREIHVTLNE